VTLSATREPTGYFTAGGRLVLDNAMYLIDTVCAHCHWRGLCGWYTGNGATIRWYCDVCAGAHCGAELEMRFRPGPHHYPEAFADGPDQVIAPFAA
jgi:hypothetical protein